MKSLGLPDDIAVTVNQLQESLPLELAVMGATGIVQGNKVNAIFSLLGQYIRRRLRVIQILPKDYKLKTWMEYVKEEDWSSFD